MLLSFSLRLFHIFFPAPAAIFLIGKEHRADSVFGYIACRLQGPKHFDSLYTARPIIHCPFRGVPGIQVTAYRDILLR